MNGDRRQQYTTAPTFNNKKSKFWQRKDAVVNKNIPNIQNNQSNCYTHNQHQFPPFYNNAQNFNANNQYAPNVSYNFNNQVPNNLPLNSNPYGQNMYNTQAAQRPAFFPTSNMPSQQFNNVNPPFYNNINPPFYNNTNQQTPMQQTPIQQLPNTNAGTYAPFYNSQHNMNNQNFVNTDSGTNNKISKKDNWHMQGAFKSIVEWLNQPKNIISVLLFIVLPILFFVSLSNHETILKIIFILGTLSACLWLFIKKIYGEGISILLGISYSILIVITVINMLTGISPTQTHRTDNTNTAQQDVLKDQESLQYTQAPTETPFVPMANEKSAAVIQFEFFMDYWKLNNFDEMIKIVAPSWAAGQNDPIKALFTLIANRGVEDYTIENVSGNDNDFARTITMSATINKHSSADPLIIRFPVLMLKENDVWYIDPSSLTSNAKEVTPDPNVSPTPTERPRTTVTPKPDASTKLYYNSNGGSYYHKNPECPSVNKKYLPLASFLYGDISNAEYKKLKPCLECGAPVN